MIIWIAGEHLNRSDSVTQNQGSWSRLLACRGVNPLRPVLRPENRFKCCQGRNYIRKPRKIYLTKKNRWSEVRQISSYCNGLKVCLTCTTEVIIPWCWLNNCQVPVHKSYPCTLCFIFLSPLCDNTREGPSNFNRGGWTRVQKSGYPVTADITYLLLLRVTPRNTSKKGKIKM